MTLDLSRIWTRRCTKSDDRAEIGRFATSAQCSHPLLSRSRRRRGPYPYPMSGGPGVVLTTGKALPPPAKDDDLPPPPPSPRDAAGPPMLPPKITLEHLPGPSTGPRSAGPPKSPDSLSLPSVTSPPGSPMSFSNFAPPSPVSATPAERPKKTNPFVDLIETEKIYVDTLSGIIRVCAHDILSHYERHNSTATLVESSFGVVEVESSTN